jgi:hypothetical protein
MWNVNVEAMWWNDGQPEKLEADEAGSSKLGS